MEVLAAFDLMGRCVPLPMLLGCSHHTVARVVAERDAWWPRLTVPASSDFGPSARFTWGGHGLTSGHSGAGSVVGPPRADRESVGVVATPIARAGRGGWLSGPVQRMDRGRVSRGVVAGSAILGLRKPPGLVIGERRRVDGLADGLDVGGSRNTWRPGIPDGRSGRVVR